MCYFAPFLQGGGILSSCNKDQDPINENFVTKDNYENLNQEIASFRTSMLDTRKSGSVMELNKAIWMMEATFNYYHSFTGEDYLETYTDSTFIPINYSGFDEVSFEELQPLYKQVNNAIVACIDAYDASNKKPYIYDLELQATPNGSQLLIMTTVGSINTQKSINIGSETPFDSTDYWYPGFLYGKCGTYTGIYAGERDASTEWPRKLRLKYNPKSFLYHFVDIETYSSYIEPEQYPYTNPYHEQYMLMQGEEDCLEPSMMNFYYNGLDYVVQDHMPTGKTFADCYIEMDFLVGETYYWKEVVKSIQYGVRVLNTDDEIPTLPELIN
jgi:hypothetical protein